MLPMPQKRGCLLHGIRSRETYGSSSRKDVYMLRKLVENGATFRKVWQKVSKSPIFFAENVFFDAYRTCYELSGLPDQPRLTYKQPKVVRTKQMESVLLFESPLDQSSFCALKVKRNIASSYHFGLTKGNCLKIFDAKTGHVLQEVFLSSQYAFKYLQWEKILERVVIKSTITPRRVGLTRHDISASQPDHVLCLTVLTACPLEFVCTMPIKTSIFGANICNASIIDGLLIVMHSKGRMVIYNFEKIMHNHIIPLKIGDHLKHGNTYKLPEMNELDCGIVGDQSIGLPVNVNLSEKPIALLELVSKGYDLSFGGIPWHYVIQKDNAFEVRSVAGNVLVKDGCLPTTGLSIETDKAYFYSNTSTCNCILHVEGPMIHYLNLVPSDSSLCCNQDNQVKDYSLTEIFCLDFGKPTPKTPTMIQTQSGRKVKQIFNSYDGNIDREVIYDLDFDDELDMIVVLYRNPDDDNAAIVGFYDNQTEQCLNTLHIDGIIDDSEHSIAIDRNALVLISKNRNDFTCSIYALTLN